MALNQNPSTVVNMKIAGKQMFFAQTNAKCWTCLNHPLKWSLNGFSASQSVPSTSPPETQVLHQPDQPRCPIETPGRRWHRWHRWHRHTLDTLAATVPQDWVFEEIRWKINEISQTNINQQYRRSMTVWQWCIPWYTPKQPFNEEHDV